MALTYGFYNSISHDRTYTAEQMSTLFDGIINDGIFQNIGGYMFVSPGSSGLTVNIATGRAWFNGTWSLNDSVYIADMGEAPYVSGFSRIDAVCLKVDKSEDVRANSFVVIKGTETSSTPIKPTIEDTESTFYHVLAYVTLSEGDTSISAASIENNIGTTEVPFVTGILETADISEMLNRWEATWNDWFTAKVEKSNTEWETFSTEKKLIFEEWFSQLQVELDDNVAANLQNQIYNITHGIYVQNGTLHLPGILKV